MGWMFFFFSFHFFIYDDEEANDKDDEESLMRACRLAVPMCVLCTCVIIISMS